MISKTIGIAAGAAAVGFIGYCIYFDSKRRSDPDFRRKLREKRRKDKQAENIAANDGFPDLSDQNNRQFLFIQEIQQGEESFAQDDIEGCVRHLSLALALCPTEQARLLGLFSQTLPHLVIDLILEALPAAEMRVAQAISKGAPPAPEMVDVELE